jgi:hypothetical protein
MNQVVAAPIRRLMWTAEQVGLVQSRRDALGHNDKGDSSQKNETVQLMGNGGVVVRGSRKVFSSSIGEV